MSVSTGVDSIRASVALGDEPVVTIVTPTFNRESFLDEMIESVLIQDYLHIDHLVLDDGSTDGTQALLERYRVRHPDRFRWVHHENMRQARTLNRGFELARGELVLILNSDDTLLPGCISRLVATFLSDPEAIAVYPNFEVIDVDGNVIVEILLPEYSFEEMVATQNNFLGPGVLFLTEMARRLGGWDPSYRVAPDLDFWMRGGLLGPYRRLPQTLATWRRHSGSITVDANGPESVAERFRFLEDWFARADLPDAIRALRPEAYRNMYVIAALAMIPTVNRPEDRFVILDRLAWQMDGNSVDRPVELELLAEREQTVRYVDAVERLQRQVAERDQWLVDVRELELRPERARAERLVDHLNAQQAAIDDLEARLVAREQRP